MSKRLIVALAGMASFTVLAVEPPLVGDPQAGAAKAATCAACHGMDGNSPAAEWPKLAGQHEDYTARQTKLVRDGARDVPTMTPFVQDLSDQDIADIAAFFAGQTVRAGVADDTVIAGRDDEVTYAGLGEKLYRAGKTEQGVPACIACHGASGHGIPGAGYPTLAGQHATYTAARLRHFHDGQNYGTDTDPSTIMVTVAQRLDSTEIDALATYIEGLHRAERNPRALAAVTDLPIDASAPADAVVDDASDSDEAPADEAAADTAEPSPGT